jgi:hypothetical protein
MDYLNTSFYKNFLLVESWKQYTLPSDKKLLLYDFYVLSYMTTALLSPPDIAMQKGSFVGRTEEELKSNIKEIENVLLPFLKKELRTVLFIAIASEIRHVFTESNISNDIPHGSPHEIYSHLFDSSNKAYADLFVAYSKKWAIRSLKTFSDPYAPLDKSDKSGIENDRFSLSDTRLLALKVAKLAMHDTNSTTVDFAKMAEYLFYNEEWTKGYGGNSWGAIAEAYSMLNQDSSKDFNNLQVVIDHIYDLQHNTDTVFNKIMDYSSIYGNYIWIKDALDFKANIINVRQLLKYCSSQMRKLALEVFKITGIPTLSKDIHDIDPAAQAIYKYVMNGIFTAPLAIYNSEITQIPSELTEVGSLSIYGAPRLTHLPDNLKVHRQLYLVDCPLITKFPKSIHIGQYVTIKGCDSFYEFSDEILRSSHHTIEIRIANCNKFQNLHLTSNKSTWITIIGCPSFTELLDGSHVDFLQISDCKSFRTLPSNVIIKNKIIIEKCDLFYNEFIKKYPNHGDSDVDYPEYEITISASKTITLKNK